ncbi:MAG: ABC transporter ATP-binding protein [Chlorobi bacterium]|nr:ABC transporter ATP-binding protein [Chlorobiota bacterium]
MRAIEVNKLTKVYQVGLGKQKVTALNDLSLTVERGSIFGLLGPNGAGKTTLIKILLGITFPTLGGARILDSDLSNYMIKKKIGFLPENHKFPNYLTAEQTLKYFAQLSGYENSNLNKRIDELLALVRMSKWKKTKVKKYSKGMMQRLGLAQAMINEPELIFLDEPTDGVDPIGRKEIRDILSDLKEKGTTIFLNSHLLSEVELVSDKVAILNEGKLLREGTVKELTTSDEVYEIETAADIPNIFSIPEFSSISISQEANKLIVNVKDNDELNFVIDYLRKNKINIKSVNMQKNSLEELFVSLIKDSRGEK